MKEKKMRSANFSHEEKVILVELARKHSLILCKNKSAVRRTEKAQEWYKLAKEFNATSGLIVSDSTYRSVDQLKMAWNSLKHGARSALAEARKEGSQTGGGVSSAPPISQLEKIVLSIIGDSTGLINELDGDGGIPTCAIPLCKSGTVQERILNKKLGLPDLHLFRAPNQEMLKIWNTKMPRGELSPKDRVCSRHFPADQIEFEIDIHLPDGTVNRMPRKVPILKEGTYPTIFPEYPPLTQEVPTPTRRDDTTLMVPYINTISHNIIINNSLLIINLPQYGLLVPNPPLDGISTAQPDLWTLQDISKLPMPCKEWNIYEFEDKAAIAHLTSECKLDKLVIFRFDSPKEPTITINGVTWRDKYHITSTQDVIDLLQEVDKLRVCQGTGILKAFSPQCSGATKCEIQLRCDACTAEMMRLQKREARLRKLLKIRKNKKIKIVD